MLECHALAQRVDEVWVPVQLILSPLVQRYVTFGNMYLILEVVLYPINYRYLYPQEIEVLEFNKRRCSIIVVSSSTGELQTPARKTIQNLNAFDVEYLPRAPYSQGLSSTAYHLFQHLHNLFNGGNHSQCDQCEPCIHAVY